MAVGTWLAEFEASMKDQFVGTRFEGQIPSLVAFETAGIANAEFVGDSWCECETHSADLDSYFRKPVKGTHGWFHDPRKGGCGGITQTG